MLTAQQVPMSAVGPAQTPVSVQQTGVTPYQTNGITDMLGAIMPLIMIMMVMMSVGKH
jgi:hypothetical protein